VDWIASVSVNGARLKTPPFRAPWVNSIARGTGEEFLYFVSLTEIVAGVLVAVKPATAPTS
jgi:hypothetical protein